MTVFGSVHKLRCRAGPGLDAGGRRRLHTRTPPHRIPSLRSRATSTPNTVDRWAALGTLAAGATAPLATPVYAQGRRTLRMVSSWSRDLALLSDAAVNAGRTITALSDGRLEVEVFPPARSWASLTSIMPSVTAMLSGTIRPNTIFRASSARLTSSPPCPFGLLMPEQHGWLRLAGGQALWEELSAHYNARAIACGRTGVQMGGWFNEPITSIEDYESITMRIPGLGGAVLREIGAQTVMTPAGQIVDALFAFDLNALEWISPNGALTFGFPKLLSTYIFPGFKEPGTVFSLGTNLELRNSFDNRDRLIVETAADIENSRSCARYYGGNGRTMFQMQSEFGTRPTRLPDEVLDVLAATFYCVREVCGAG